MRISQHTIWNIKKNILSDLYGTHLDKINDEKEIFLRKQHQPGLILLTPHLPSSKYASTLWLPLGESTSDYLFVQAASVSTPSLP